MINTNDNSVHDCNREHRLGLGTTSAQYSAAYEKSTAPVAHLNFDSALANAMWFDQAIPTTKLFEKDFGRQCLATGIRSTQLSMFEAENYGVGAAIVV